MLDVMMAPVVRVRSWAATHPGAKRGNNEDAFLDRPDLGLWAVADGAGGHQAGEVASATVIDALGRIPSGLGAGEMLAQVRLRVAEAHKLLLDEGARRGQGAILATTLVVLIIRDHSYACLWAGDSRLYLLHKGSLTQVTDDHSLVQEMVEAGLLRPEDAESHPRANVVTRAVGAMVDLELDKTIGRTVPGDRFLLCSDGLSKCLDNAEIAVLLAAPDGVPCTELLIGAALAKEAGDNVTVVAAEV